MTPLVTRVDTFESLAAAIRAGRLCVPVTELKLDHLGLNLQAPAMLVADGDNLYLDARITPPTDKSSIQLNQCNDLTSIKQVDALVDGRLSVKLHEVFPLHSWLLALMAGTQRFSFEEVVYQNSVETDSPAQSISITARIAESTLHFHNLSSTTEKNCSLRGQIEKSYTHSGLGGRIESYQYSIRQEAEDVEIDVRLCEGCAPTSRAEDERFFGALIVSFIWLNGAHPYVSYVHHQRDGVTVKSSLQPLKRSPRLKGRLIAHDPTGELAIGFMEASTRFFMKESPLKEDLWLFLRNYRETTIEGSITISSLLQACTLLEGVIGVVLRHPFSLSKNQIKKLPPPPGGGTDNGTAAARFFHASKHLGFDWVTEFKPVFDVWKRIRDELAHGNLREFEAHADHAVIACYLRIIQAFNAIALRLIGYQGKICLDGCGYAIRLP